MARIPDERRAEAEAAGITDEIYGRTLRRVATLVCEWRELLDPECTGNIPVWRALSAVAVAYPDYDRNSVALLTALICHTTIEYVCAIGRAAGVQGIDWQE